MSVAVLSADQINLLATALIRYADLPADQGPELARTLLKENVDAYLWRYFDGPEVLDDPDYDDGDEEELEELRETLRDHTFAPARPKLLDPEAIRDALMSWRYQTEGVDHHADLPGWQLGVRLEAALPR